MPPISFMAILSFRSLKTKQGILVVGIFNRNCSSWIPSGHVSSCHTHTGCISRQFFQLHAALKSELELNRALNFWSLKEKVSRKLICFEPAICAFSIWCLFACCCFSYSCSLKVMNIFCVIYFSFYSFHVALCSRRSRARNCWIWKTHNFNGAKLVAVLCGEWMPERARKSDAKPTKLKKYH